MKPFDKSVANIVARPQIPTAVRKARPRQMQYEKDRDAFIAIPGINFLRALRARLHVLWTTTGWQAIDRPPLRWIYPHQSFTCKGPGIEHVEGTNAKAPYQRIHKSLTKTVNRSYTQNKQEILNRQSLAELLTEEPPRSDVSDQPVA